MPEGHSIHRLAHALTETFSDQQLMVSSPQGRFLQGAKSMDGHYALAAQAWGKHLFWPVSMTRDEVELGEDGPAWLHVHLGLYGSWSFHTPGASGSIGAPRVATAPSEEWHAPEPGPNVRLRIETETAVADLTGPNQCELLTGPEVRVILNRLGPDPLREGGQERFIAKVRERKASIGQLVMDQSVAAGPGNIYRAECLWRVGIHPRRPGNRVSVTRLALLWKDLVSAMSDGYRDGIIATLPAEYQLAEPADDNDQRFAVYHRTGRPCPRCGTAVTEANMASRRLFWCPGCQR